MARCSAEDHLALTPHGLGLNGLRRRPASGRGHVPAKLYSQQWGDEADAGAGGPCVSPGDPVRARGAAALCRPGTREGQSLPGGGGSAEVTPHRLAPADYPRPAHPAHPAAQSTPSPSQQPVGLHFSRGVNRKLGKKRDPEQGLHQGVGSLQALRREPAITMTQQSCSRGQRRPGEARAPLSPTRGPASNHPPPPWATAPPRLLPR